MARPIGMPAGASARTRRPAAARSPPGGRIATLERLPHSTAGAGVTRPEILCAKDLLQRDSIFNDKARQYLSFAYRMMTNGKKYETPKELEVFVIPTEAQEKAQKYAKKLMDEALAALAKGNKGETARLLLEIVLMVVTPVSG